MGAVLGGVVLVALDAEPIVLGILVGVLIGSVVGGVVGAGVGVLNGSVLAVLSKTPVLRPAAPGRRHRATAAVVVTTVIAGLAVQLPLFGSIADRIDRWLLVCLPVAVGALVAAALSRRLPLGGDHAPGAEGAGASQ